MPTGHLWVEVNRPLPDTYREGVVLGFHFARTVAGYFCYDLDAINELPELRVLPRPAPRAGCTACGDPGPTKGVDVRIGSALVRWPSNSVRCRWTIRCGYSRPHARSYGKRRDFRTTDCTSQYGYKGRAIAVEDALTGDTYVLDGPCPIYTQACYDGDFGSCCLGARLSFTARYRADDQQNPYSVGVVAGGSVQYVYDPETPGATLWYSYEGAELTRVSVGVANNTEPVLSLGYSARGLLTHSSGTCGACGIGYMDYEYDDWDRVTATTDYYGATTRQLYDYSGDIGRRSAVLITSGPNALTREKVLYDYDYAEKTYNTRSWSNTDMSITLRDECR